METGRKMETSTVMTGRDLQQTKNDIILTITSQNKTRQKKTSGLFSPQHNHTVGHESPNGDICNKDMRDLESQLEDMTRMQHLLSAEFTPANPNNAQMS